jgi:hypothetical protein
LKVRNISKAATTLKQAATSSLSTAEFDRVHSESYSHKVVQEVGIKSLPSFFSRLGVRQAT